MTRRRDLKRRVRERQAHTGESYMTALRHVQSAVAPTDELAAAPAVPAIPFIELLDLTELAAALGMHGQFAMYPELLERVSPAATLTQFRAALHQPRLAPMRAVVIDGALRSDGIWVEDVYEFHRACAQGRPMTTANGLLTALMIDDPRGATLVAFMVTQSPPFANVRRPARLMIAPTSDWRYPWGP